MLAIAIMIGLVLSLFLVDILGLAAGGMVVPGYIALFMDKPVRVGFTLLSAFLALLTLKLISSYALIYGKRRLVLVILLGFIYGYLIRFFIEGYLPGFSGFADPIGFIIPGLIAYWMERQGIIETILTMSIVAVIVRLLLIIINGGRPIEMAF
ncbi:MAG: poly-gamma-glutamate biosynthesis protein PgsC [bacterium]